MELFVGTSGWFYSWNKEKTLDWFVRNSGLNAIELNASFYRFPFPNQIKAWAKKGKSLRWAIKVNRLVTHQYKFNNQALAIWKKFARLFEPLDNFIDFYLFQLPPSFVNIKKAISFAEKIKLKERFALEPRNKKIIENLKTKEIEKLNEKITLVSLDSPDFQIIFPGKIVYLRMHGRSSWYSHNYSKKELKEICKKIKEARPEKTYVFFNNNHNMLNNAKTMLNLLKT